MHFNRYSVDSSRRHPRIACGCLIAIVGAALQLNGFSAIISVDVSGGLGEAIFVQASGDPLPAGNEVRLGTLAPNIAPPSTLANFAPFAVNFDSFGSTTITQIVAGGHLGASFARDDLGFADRPIALWVFKTVGNEPVEPSFGNVFEHGIFASTDGAWFFPSGAELLPTRLLSTNQIHSAVVGTVLASGAAPNHLRLVTVAIPEPASFALTLLGTLHVLLRRPSRCRLNSSQTQDNSRANAIRPASGHSAPNHKALSSGRDGIFARIPLVVGSGTQSSPDCRSGSQSP